MAQGNYMATKIVKRHSTFCRIGKHVLGKEQLIMSGLTYVHYTWHIVNTKVPKHSAGGSHVCPQEHMCHNMYAWTKLARTEAPSSALGS